LTPVRPDTNTGHADPARLAALLLCVMLGTALFLTAAWFKFHSQIAIGILALGGAELRIIGLFTHAYDQTLINLRQAVPEQVSAQTLWALCTLTGTFFRWPAVGIIVGLAVLCLTRAPRERYRERFGFEGLQRALARIHPIGLAWVGASLPLSAPAPPGAHLRPLDPALRVKEWKPRYLGDTTGRARIDAAERALTQQLGQPWNGPEAAAPIDQCLFMVFALQAERQKSEALELLGQLSAALAGRMKRGAPAGALALPPRFVRYLSKRLASRRWDEAHTLAARHAFTRPALLTLLQHARVRSGVLNAGLFSTVQLVDRELWLVLAAASYPRPNMPLSMMSAACCIEASAAIEHWQAESGAGARLPDAHIHRTLMALAIPNDEPGPDERRA
jgi:intracellular multiplication protein IcmP